MASANLIFKRTFDGAGYPSFAVEWPGFDFTADGTINKSGWSRPVVDGFGNGIPSRTVSGVTWRGRATTMPGRSDYQADLHCRWANAGFAGRREVGLIVHMVDTSNCVIARVRSMGTSSAELRLFKVIGGAETQLGSTYTGTGVDAATMNVRMGWRVRIEDLADGTTSVAVYTAPTGAATKGTQRLAWTGDLSTLRGAHGVGIELRDQVGGTDVYVDDLEVYDLADEWVPAGGTGDTSGWTLVFGESSAKSLSELRELATAETRMRATVRQAYGVKGNRATISLRGDWRMGTVLKPGTKIIALHNGVTRFRGWIASGEQSADPSESQTWQAFDAYWEARKVVLQADDLTSTLYFNVADTESDNYDVAKKDKTIGWILAYLFDRYTDGASNSLRFYGAAPVSGAAYTTTETDVLDAVIPDIGLSGSFTAAIETLLRYMPKYQVWVDPVDSSWHFVDVTALSEQEVVLTTDHVLLKVSPDRDKSYGAIELRGAKKERDDSVTLKLSDGSLKPAWTTAQENTATRDKAFLGNLAGKIVGAGTAVLDGVLRPYFDISADLGAHEDDFRGGICPSGLDAYDRFIIHNTSTRFWLSSPVWAPTPSAGDTFYVSVVDPAAVPGLSAAGVGRAYFMDPTIVCGYASAYDAGLKFNGFCGRANVFGADDEKSKGYSVEYNFRAYAMTAAQQAAGFCDPLIVLSRVPKPPNGTPSRSLPAGGSPPSSSCVAGNSNKASQIPQVDVQVSVSRVKTSAPVLRKPATGLEGDAYEAGWNPGTLVLDDPNFTSLEEQGEGYGKALQATLDLISGRAFMLEVTIATPWRAINGDVLEASRTSVWAGLGKRLKISSARRPTGLENIPNLSEFAVEWDLFGGTTKIEAGTAAGWLQPEFKAISEAFSKTRILKQTLAVVKDVEDFRNRLISKAADRVGGDAGGTIDGCTVSVVNQNTRTVKDVSTDDQNKEAWINHGALRAKVLDGILGGLEQTFAGAPLEVPGYDGAAAQQVVDGGPALRTLAVPGVPFQGPSTLTNGDRGRYGGLIETDAATSGSPPRELLRIGGFSFRKALTSDGRSGGASAVEVAQLDARGVPGSYVPYEKPTDLPGAFKFPIGAVAAGSIPRQLLDQTQELARQANAFRDETGKILASGDDSSALYPDGAPASVSDVLRAGGGLFGPFFKMVPQSFGDPGGMVFEGPMTPEGATAGCYWRVLMPECVPVRVTAVTPGTGTNGGAFSNWTGGPGGSMEYLAAGYVVHKQIHARDLSSATFDANGDAMEAAAPPAAATDPFCLVGQEGRVVSGADISGAGSRISLPASARGTPLVTVHLSELAAETAGHVLKMNVGYAYRASPWTTAAVSSTATALTADGSGTGTGVFSVPIGAVPSGLRRPADLVVVAQTVPGSGTYGGLGVIGGIDFDVAVVEGGYLVRFREDLAGADAWVDSAPRFHEGLEVEETWKVSPGLSMDDAVELLEAWDMQGSKPAQIAEALEMSEVWAAVPS